MHGPGGAREAIRLLADAWKSPEEVNNWMERFIPLRSELSGPEGFRGLVEEWWNMIGVVPGSRHLELQEKCEILKARLEEAKATIQQMRTTQGIQGRAREMLDLWERAIQRTLTIQNEWLRIGPGLSARQKHPNNGRNGTMEWTKPAENMFNTWMDAQTKMWDEWFKSTQGFGKMQGTEVWRKTVEAWEQSLKKNLNLQMDWTKLWADSFTKVSADPAELFEWAQQGQEMMRRWLATQMQLWAGWFEIMKKLDPSTPGGGWQREAEKIVQLWQEALKKGLDAQVEWGRVWSAGQEGKKPKEHAKS